MQTSLKGGHFISQSSDTGAAACREIPAHYFYQCRRGQQLTTEQRTIEFHSAFGHPVRDIPQTLSREEALLALKLIEEEFLELAEALFPTTRSIGYGEDWDMTLTGLIEESPEHYPYEPNLIETADAVADLDVVVNGFGIRSGFDMQSLSREVFTSNMSKLGADGKPIYHPNGKIAKGPHFKQSDIAKALGIE